MKELYYFSRFENEEIKKCPVTKETSKTYEVEIGGWKRVIRKATMTTGDTFSQIRIFETEEQAKASHLEYLKRQIGYLEGEVERCTAKAERYKAIIKDLYGGEEK